MSATLYLIPTSLGHTRAGLFASEHLALCRSLKLFFVEREKSARAFLKELELGVDQSALRMLELDKHQPENGLEEMLQLLQSGHDAGLMSEAGLPCVGDPGYLLVRKAQKAGVKVQPLPGPSSFMLALMGSGFSGQQFSFRGYLPIDKAERRQLIKQMQKEASKGHTQIFMETPYRNMKLLEELLESLPVNSPLCIACDLSLPTEMLQTKSIAQWKKNPPDLQKRPTVFLLGQ
jgi:16S rRNA (cytidine1402-2'-O)-methyltransferase